jgi:hypothetical protein
MSDHDSPRRPGTDTSRSSGSTLRLSSVAFRCLVCRFRTLGGASWEHLAMLRRFGITAQLCAEHSRMHYVMDS